VTEKMKEEMKSRRREWFGCASWWGNGSKWYFPSCLLIWATVTRYSIHP
jgi:hypothetical protein